MLAMPFPGRTEAGREVAGEEDLPEARLPQPRGAVGYALLIHEERKRDAGLFAKGGAIRATAQADSRDARPRALEPPLVIAQPGDVLAAEDSAIVAKERDNGRPRFPKRTDADSPAVRVWKDDRGERLGGRSGHAGRLPREDRHSIRPDPY
jgi:hypothetical protein